MAIVGARTLVGSDSPKEIGKVYVGPMMNAATQQWVPNVHYMILEQVSEEEFAEYVLTEFGFELAPIFRGAYYYRVSVD